mgnify:CR=1 FL=1
MTTDNMIQFLGYLAGPIMAWPVEAMLALAAVNAALAAWGFWEVRA